MYLLCTFEYSTANLLRPCESQQCMLHRKSHSSCPACKWIFRKTILSSYAVLSKNICILYSSRKHWIFPSDQFFWNYYYDFNILYSTPLDVTHGNVTTKHHRVSSVQFSAVEALCAVVPTGKYGSQVSLLSFYKISFCFNQSSLYLYCRNIQAIFAC